MQNSEKLYSWISPALCSFIPDGIITGFVQHQQESWLLTRFNFKGVKLRWKRGYDGWCIHMTSIWYFWMNLWKLERLFLWDLYHWLKVVKIGPSFTKLAHFWSTLNFCLRFSLVWVPMRFILMFTNRRRVEKKSHQFNQKLVHYQCLSLSYLIPPDLMC